MTGEESVQCTEVFNIQGFDVQRCSMYMYSMYRGVQYTEVFNLQVFNWAGSTV